MSFLDEKIRDLKMMEEDIEKRIDELEAFQYNVYYEYMVRKGLLKGDVELKGEYGVYMRCKVNITEVDYHSSTKFFKFSLYKYNKNGTLSKNEVHTIKDIETFETLFKKGKIRKVDK